MRIILIIFLAACNLLFAQSPVFVENHQGDVYEIDMNSFDYKELYNVEPGIYGIALDNENGYIFFSNVAEDKIYRSKHNGDSLRVILSNDDGINSPRGIDIDPVNKIVYWVESLNNRLCKANYDGSELTTILEGLASPVDVAVDLIDKFIYISENAMDEKSISRYCMEKHKNFTIIDSIGHAAGIDVDAYHKKLYWVDYGSDDKVMRSDLDGSNAEILFPIENGSPRGIAVNPDNKKLYWSDVLNNSIHYTNTADISMHELPEELENPLGIDIFSYSNIPEITSLKDKKAESSELPDEYKLSQNYPNPFNPATRIQFSIPEAGRVLINVYNLLGERVSELVDEYKTPGRYTVNFDASNLSNGIYIYRLKAGDFVSIKKMTLLK